MVIARIESKRILAYGLVVIIVLSLAITACTPEEPDQADLPDWVDVMVGAGDNPPPPEEVGAEYVEPREPPRGVIEGLDMATFGERWNEAAVNLNRPELVFEVIEVRYALMTMVFSHEVDDWALYGSIDYKSGHMEYAGVDWTITESIDEEVIVATWAAVIYATDPEIATPEGLMSVIDELGIYDLTTEELMGHELNKVIGSLRYYFYSTETWGEFLMEPNGRWDERE